MVATLPPTPLAMAARVERAWRSCQPAICTTSGGKIHGGTGGASSDFSGAGAGGTGVYLATSLAINGGVPTLFAQGTLANNGLIIGGTGGYGSGFAQGGNGGAGVFVAAAGSVTNNGVIEGGTAGGNTTQLDGAAGQGVYLANYADLTNTGNILGATGQGRLSGGIGVYAHGSNTIINQFSISGGAGGSYSSASFGNGGFGVYINQSVLINNSRITGGNAGGNNIQTATPGYGGTGVYINGGTVINTGTIAGGQSNGTFGYAVQFGPAATGTLEVLPTAVFIGNVTAVAGQGDELLLENSGGSLSGLGTQFSGFDEIAFAPGAAWQISGNTLGLETSLGIAGFTLGDTITLTGISGAGETETYSNGELTLASGGSTLATLSFSGEAPSINSGNFAISTDGTNTTIVAALCYLRGTLILTPAGERPIEDLRIGDLVATKFGGAQKIKWIGRQSYDARFLRHNPGKMPVCIRAGALGADMPARDLYISPGHSMLLDKTLVLASHLINGITITQDFARDGVVDYFQLEFSGHDCVIAEGAWAESYADGPGLRGQFHNMADYHALYPDEPAATGLKLCADRPERGPDLARALAPVIARAAAGLTPGPVEGFIDHVSANRIEGWALDQNHPDLPVTLDILWRGRILGSILACDGRDDLAAAGKGRCRCAFFFTPSEPLPPESWAEIELRRGNDTLPRSGAFQVSKKAVLF